MEDVEQALTPRKGKLDKVALTNARDRRSVIAASKTDYALLWEKHDKHGHDFFGAVIMSHDGGYSEVPDLWGRMRWFFALLAIAFVSVNIRATIVLNVGILMSGEEFLTQECADMRLGRGEHCMSVMSKARCANATIAEACCSCGGGKHHPLLISDHISAWLNSHFASDPSEAKRLNPRMFVAILEIVLMGGMLLRLFRNMRVAFFEKSHGLRWHAVTRIFWDIIPLMQTISAMRLLNYITPGVFVPALMIHIKRSLGRHCSKHGLPIFVFAGQALLAGVVGFDAFLIKFHQVSEDMYNGNGLVPSLVFLNQLLGVVQVGWFVQRRLFSFVFGGEDGVVQDEDLTRERVWKSMLAREIWHVFGCGPRFLAIMLSYGDTDFQRLALNDAEKAFNAREGLWVDEQDQSQHRIEGSRLLYADGRVARIHVSRNSDGRAFFIHEPVEGQSAVYGRRVSGQLSANGTRIEWSNETIWTRDERNGAASPTGGV